MLNLIAKRFAKTRYIFNQLVDAASNELNASLALRMAKEKRELVARLTKEADEMDARIKELDEKLEKGFWECENGHEFGDFAPQMIQSESGPVKCERCEAPAKFIKRDQMTGQEKYESDKERKEAEDMAKQKRDQAKAEEENAANSEKTAIYFQGIAQNNRNVAEKLRQL